MKTLILIFIVLISGILMADWVMQYPGQILIYYGGKEVRMTLAVGVLLIVIATTVFYGGLSLLKGLISIPSNLRRRREWKARESFSDAFIVSALGEENKAERLFIRGAKYGSSPEAHFIAAAEVAHKKKNLKRRDQYLEAAAKSSGNRSIAIIKQAEWLLEEGQIDQAEAIIEKAPYTISKRPNVLKIKGDIYHKKANSKQLISILPELSRKNILDPQRLEELQISAYTKYLTSNPEITELSAIRRLWKKVPRNIKGKRAVLSTYVGILFRLNEHSEAEKVLRKQIELDWDPHLVALYGEIRTHAPQKILKRLELWSADHQNDPGLGIAKARQCMHAGMWGQARGVISNLLEKTPSPTLYKILADIDEKLGDEKRALKNRRAGLELAADIVSDQ